MLYEMLPTLDRSAEYQFSPADPILPRSEWLVVHCATWLPDRALDSKLFEALFCTRITTCHYESPCIGGENCEGPCYDYCDCIHCDGGWVRDSHFHDLSDPDPDDCERS